MCTVSQASRHLQITGSPPPPKGCFRVVDIQWALIFGIFAGEELIGQEEDQQPNEDQEEVENEHASRTLSAPTPPSDPESSQGQKSIGQEEDQQSNDDQKDVKTQHASRTLSAPTPPSDSDYSRNSTSPSSELDVSADQSRPTNQSASTKSTMN